jgi:hypothetical protein
MDFKIERCRQKGQLDKALSDKEMRKTIKRWNGPEPMRSYLPPNGGKGSLSPLYQHNRTGDKKTNPLSCRIFKQFFQQITGSRQKPSN